MLRSTKQSDDYLDEFTDEQSNEIRIVERGLTIQMINKLNSSHRELSPYCVAPHFELEHEMEWGLGWIWKMKCTHCTFHSESLQIQILETTSLAYC